MKRLLASLLAIFGLALLAPHEAKASVTCTAVSTTNLNYPYKGHAFYCGAATLANGQTMAARVHSDGATVGNELFRAGVNFYLFDTVAEYVSNFPSHPTIAANSYGVVAYDTRNTPTYVAIFQHQNSAAATLNTNIDYTTNLQVADAADFLLGYMSNGGVQPPINSRFSSSTLFLNQANADWTAFKLKTPCRTMSSGQYQVFSKEADSTSVVATNTYNYICDGASGTGYNLMPGYSGGMDAILNKAWPGVYTTLSGTTVNLNYQGLFQQELALAMGADDTVTPRSMSAYVKDPNNSDPARSFQCSQYELKQTLVLGHLPAIVDASRPAACAAPAIASKCVKIFNLQGYWPDGNIFDCSLAGTVGNGVITQLGKLGGNSTNTLIKQDFNLIRSNIFLFDTYADFHTTFMNAGIWEPGAGPVVLAGTYSPSVGAGIWYTFINLSGYPGGIYSAQNVGYTASHEIGHAFDDTFGASQPSASASFDLAMQHDWLNLDYTVWNSPTSFTLRGPCSTSAPRGPFIGVVDAVYSPAIQICSGGALNTQTGADGTSPATRYAGKRNSDILRNARIEGISGHGPLYNGTTGIAGPGYTSAIGWREWHADSFATVAKTDIASDPSDPTIPTIVGNGYFQCTAGPSASNSFVYQEYNTGGLPVTPPCQTAMPAGWVTNHQTTASP